MCVRLRFVALLSLTILLFAFPIAAQNAPVRLQAPFGFTAGDRNLPAGEYTASLINMGGIPYLRISGAFNTVFVIVHSAQIAEDVPSNPAKFTEGTEGYTLHKVWIGGHWYDLMHSKMDDDLR